MRAVQTFQPARALRVLGSAALALAALAAGPLGAADLSGKRIEAIVPFGEGGGGDTYTRYMARNLEPHLEGAPTIVIRNMPGGGSVNGANWFAANAADDGTNFAVASTSTTLTYALRPDDPRVKFDPRQWQAFIASPMGRVVYVHSKTGITGVEDLKTFDGTLLMGLQSPTGSDMPSLLSIELLGVEVQPIFGTDGGDEHLGFQRGELTVNADVASAYLQMAQPLVDEGTAVPLFSFGYQDESGAIVRDPNFPDLPSWVEAYRIVHGEDPSGPAFEVWQALFNMAVMSSKALVLPGDAPDDVVALYDAAVTEMISDPTFQAESGEFIGTYPQLTGEAARRSLSAASTSSDEGRQWVADWLKQRFDVDL
jgi:hypothetical protein